MNTTKIWQLRKDDVFYYKGEKHTVEYIGPCPDIPERDNMPLETHMYTHTYDNNEKIRHYMFFPNNFTISKYDNSIPVLK